MLIDHTNHDYHGKKLWVIYGVECAPSILCCKLESKLHGYTVIWGFSVYRGKPGFRTLGKNVDTWISEYRNKYGWDLFEFYNDHTEALDRIRDLTDPSSIEKNRTVGQNIVKEWESKQNLDVYSSYYESMEGLAQLIDETIAAKQQQSLQSVDKPVDNPIDYEYINDYRARQQELRDAGFDAYNCDEVDEFPRW